MFPAHQHSFRAAKLLLGALIFLLACSCALSSIGETCYSRQHRDTIVNVRKALDHQKRKKEAERDCILACCSEELKPGIKCNMVMYKPSSQDGIENCYLFHCETEQDCPLMSAKPGTNTYDIFKGMTHPAAKGKERAPTMPIMITKQPSTTQSTSTTMKPTTTTTTTQPTTTTSTMQSSTTTHSNTTTTSTIAPTELAIILLTMPVEIVPTATSTTTTTTTTQSTTTTTKVPSTTSTTTTTHPVEPPPNPVRPLKKQIRPPKKPEPHGKSNPKVVVVEMENELKNRDSDPAGASASDKSNKKSHLMWKNSLALLVVLTLIILMFVLAIVGRRAMESFDRRHYTRLELNDLHYEI
ncbi:hypothetical protein KOW79_016041 [Hemibagrus wyckioides]|uniref:Seven cysteines N-terminal domain-containing protein n=1 Tax=Hemibagrus wyckioides TaxID=337641 RepID=A0A9D3NF95_9TELE|nr:hypothetical protein KOW79_016041 [Hemibagrus wyckioides]